MTSSAVRKRIEVFLQPGEYCVGGAGHRIRTVLGSCVSVTLWDPVSRVGAMSHFLLATRGARSKRVDDVRGLDLLTLDARYGDEALRLMLHDLALRKVAPTACHAKIFGGGNMFPHDHAGGATAIGRRNGEAARGLLQEHGIEIASESLFGDGHRQIAFDVETGHVWARQVTPSETSMPGGEERMP
ncbi:MAG: chemotaxis protein CheD [Pseudomonadota bacterium]|nr:chemotaxis protein CheD [Pseudomonadota bacterium]